MLKFRDRLFVVSLLSRDVPRECSISEGLAKFCSTSTSPISNKARAIPRLHENVLATENPENRWAYKILVLSHRKFDILESFVCS